MQTGSCWNRLAWEFYSDGLSLSRRQPQGNRARKPPRLVTVRPSVSLSACSEGCRAPGAWGLQRGALGSSTTEFCVFRRVLPAVHFNVIQPPGRLHQAPISLPAVTSVPATSSWGPRIRCSRVPVPADAPSVHLELKHCRGLHVLCAGQSLLWRQETEKFW